MHKKLWNKDYILLLQGNTVSTMGDLMYSVAIGYWVYQQTGSSALMGVMSSISMFVTMFLSPVCGSIVDKCNRQCLIVGIDIAQGLLMVGVGMLAWMNALSVPVVLVTALLAAFGSVFYSPAVNTLMIDIIPRKDMVRGQSIHSGISTLINLVGKVFSGVMVAFVGVPSIVVFNGLSNLYAAVAEMFLFVPRTVQQGTQVTIKGIVRDSASAVKTIFSNPSLRLFVPCALILNLLAAGPSALMLPFCMEKGFSVDRYGYVASVMLMGHLLCTMLLGFVKLKPATRFWVMAIGFSSSVMFFIAGYFSRRFIPMCALLFLGSLANGAGNTIFSAALMLALPQENRSAILGVVQSASCGGMALSSVIYGFLGDLFPLYLVFAAGNIMSLIPMLYMCFHKRTKEFVLQNCE